jgi:uncharacterized membrane protein
MRTIIFFIVLAGCGSEAVPVFGPPTETMCPPAGTSLTYANFGKAFMDEYCITCHDQNLVGTERMGAPSFHDFDTYFGIVPVADHVDETSAGGPAAMNRGMPPAGFKAPTDTERLMLGEWIACGLPEQ